MSSRWCVRVVLGASACVGCSSPHPTVTEPVHGTIAPAALHQGPLTDYVPAAGLRWLAVAHLAKLAHDPQIAPKLELLFPKARLDGFHRAAGIDLTTTDTALAAGFDLAVLYAAEIHGSSSEIVARFNDRLIAGSSLARPHPRLARVSGVVGTIPEMLVAVDDELVAVSVGDPTPARIVELFSLNKLKHSPPALLGSALSSLPVTTQAGTIQFYAPGPFEREWLTGARGLLSVATALAIVAEPIDDTLDVHCLLAGAWIPEHEDELRKTWEDLAQSSLGKLLGLDSPVAQPTFHADPALLSVDARFAVGPLVAGLRAAVAADVWEIMGLSSSEPK